MSTRITLEQLAHMQIGEIANLSQQEIQELILEADESIRKAKLLRKWLDGALEVKRRHAKKQPTNGEK
jgi:hypothetical protein